MITKVEGFILSTVNYGETSLVIQLFTKEYGIIGLMAKGAKSMKNKLHALTLPYTYGFFYVYLKPNKLSILKDVDLITPFKNIHNDITLISTMTYLSDLTAQVFKESEEQIIYDLFINGLKKIEDGFDPLVITNILEVKYLNFLGVGFVLDSCINCQSKTNIVTIGEGGLICKNCYVNEPIIPLACIKLIRLYEYVDINSIKNINVSDKNKKIIDVFLENYYHQYTGMYLKSKKFLDKIKDSIS